MQRLLTIPLLLLAVATACSTSIPGYGPGADRADAGEGEGQSEVDAGPEEDLDPIQIEVAPSILALLPNETAQVVATVTGDDVVSGSEISWISANDLVAVVDENGLIRAVGDGEVEITAEVSGAINASSASVLVTVSAAAECPDGTGNNNDSCANIYKGKDIWRCTVSPKLGNVKVSQVCRDSGAGAKWINFHIAPTDCCECAGAFSVACCAKNSGSAGCP